MTLWLALRRLLPLLAVLSLALTPMIAPAATAGMHASPALSGHGLAMTGHHADKASVPEGPDGGMADQAGMVMDDMVMDDMVMDDTGMDDMPCCPKAAAEAPACAKGCPLMALCLASVASLLPAVPPLPVPAATRASPAWAAPATFASLHGPPLPEPPRP